MKKQDSNKDIQITNPDIDEYARKMTSAESESIKTLIRQSGEQLEFIDMLSGRLVGQLLKMLVSVSGAKRILEVGTFTGFSALIMAEALPDDGQIITMEMNEKYYEIAKNHFSQFDAGKKIDIVKGNARFLISELTGSFDLVYLDADKISYPFYYEKILEKLNAGGLLVADNVLWSGSVLNANDPKSKAMNEFNQLVKNDERVEQILLPIRDGVTIIRKI